MFGFPRKRPEQFRANKIRFIGEQDGPPEQQLKRCLAELFSQEQRIRRAYLVRVNYGDAANSGVALCLSTPSGENPEVAQKVGKVFAGLFSQRASLDIVFLTDEKEAELAKCCKPFFDSFIRTSL